jgi:hypothetical protein
MTTRGTAAIVALFGIVILALVLGNQSAQGPYEPAVRGPRLSMKNSIIRS